MGIWYGAKKEDERRRRDAEIEKERRREERDFRERQRKAEEKRQIDRYLVPLLNALASLWYRLDNILAPHEGKARMGEASPYYLTSSLYVLATFLAHKRRLVVEGVYAQVEDVSKLGDTLMARLEAVEDEIGGDNTPEAQFFRYARLALAESALVWDGDSYRVLGYLEFSARATDETDPIAVALEPARKYWKLVSERSVLRLMKSIGDAAVVIEDWTQLEAPFRGKKCSHPGTSRSTDTAQV